jgi:hypothetical protein
MNEPVTFEEMRTTLLHWHSFHLLASKEAQAGSPKRAHKARASEYATLAKLRNLAARIVEENAAAYRKGMNP